MQRRWSPYETLELDSEEGETPFASIHHCLWFSIASWVQQGCDFLPRYVHKHVPKNSQETENLARIHECNFKLEILSTFCVSIIIFNFSCSYLHLLKGHIIADRGQFLVVFHTHHDIVLYCQSRGLSNHRENGSSYQFRRGLGQAIQDQIRMFTIRIYKRVLSGKPFYILPKKSGF